MECVSRIFGQVGRVNERVPLYPGYRKLGKPRDVDHHVDPCQSHPPEEREFVTVQNQVSGEVQFGRRCVLSAMKLYMSCPNLGHAG